MLEHYCKLWVVLWITRVCRKKRKKSALHPFITSLLCKLEWKAISHVFSLLESIRMLLKYYIVRLRNFSLCYQVYLTCSGAFFPSPHSLYSIKSNKKFLWHFYSNYNWKGERAEEKTVQIKFHNWKLTAFSRGIERVFSGGNVSWRTSLHREGLLKSWHGV